MNVRRRHTCFSVLNFQHKLFFESCIIEQDKNAGVMKMDCNAERPCIMLISAPIRSNSQYLPEFTLRSNRWWRDRRNAVGIINEKDGALVGDIRLNNPFIRSRDCSHCAANHLICRSHCMETQTPCLVATESDARCERLCNNTFPSFLAFLSRLVGPETE